jgi:inhibitor of cysteine peptidase
MVSTSRFARRDRIFSTRFIGDKGYVVTFEQHDPMIVLDLSDPETPKVLGEAIIPGFSDYMHPIVR